MRKRLNVRGVPSLFTRLPPLSTHPFAALNHDGFVPIESLCATKTSESSVTVNVTSVVPVNAFESFAVRIHSEPATAAGTAVNVNARSPY